jgi:sec-independent protein translocase protein TatC
VPVVVIVLVRSGLVSIQKLKEARPYVIVGAFVVGAVFTPPDILSQVMLAVPLWLLYELGIVLAHFVSRRAEPEAAAGDAQPVDDAGGADAGSKQP